MWVHSRESVNQNLKESERASDREGGGGERTRERERGRVIASVIISAI